MLTERLIHSSTVLTQTLPTVSSGAKNVYEQVNTLPSPSLFSSSDASLNKDDRHFKSISPHQADKFLKIIKIVSIVTEPLELEGIESNHKLFSSSSRPVARQRFIRYSLPK